MPIDADRESTTWISRSGMSPAATLALLIVPGKGLRNVDADDRLGAAGERLLERFLEGGRARGRRRRKGRVRLEHSGPEVGRREIHPGPKALGGEMHVERDDADPGRQGCVGRQVAGRIRDDRDGHGAGVRPR